MRLISIIIPTYNSEKNILKLTNILRNVSFKNANKEVIIVNDASRDNTAKILKSIKGVKVISHQANRGKGGAVMTGLRNAKGDIFFIQDDDLEYDPNDIPKVVKPILENKAEIVFGSRMLNQKEFASMYNFGRIFLNKIISLILGVNITDSITGSKAFTKKVLEKISPLKSTGFDIETEIVAKSIRKGFMPMEVPISYKPRTKGEGKNIRWHHSLPIIFTTIRFLISD